MHFREKNLEIEEEAHKLMMTTLTGMLTKCFMLLSYLEFYFTRGYCIPISAAKPIQEINVFQAKAMQNAAVRWQPLNVDEFQTI